MSQSRKVRGAADIKTCAECGAEFTRPYRLGFAQWEQRKVCGAACRTARAKVPLRDRFWTHVDTRGPDDCWVWTGATSNRGYGSVGGDQGKTVGSHRVAWELTNGPTDLYVLHRCDNPPCCNPAHLFLGTHADNMADMSAKGRTARANTRLTDEQVAEIRAKYVREYERYIRGWRSNQRELAAEYGMSRDYINQLIRGVYRSV